MPAKTILLEKKYGSWGWPDPAKLMQADESHTVTIKLAVGVAQILRILINNVEVYPTVREIIVNKGDNVNIQPYIKNIGDSGTIFVRVSSPEVTSFRKVPEMLADTSYWEEVMQPLQEFSLDFMFDFVMPGINVNLTVEAGHV